MAPLTVVCNDVDTAELLHEHDEERALCSATVASDGEELLKDVAALLLFLLDL